MWRLAIPIQVEIISHGTFPYVALLRENQTFIIIIFFINIASSTRAHKYKYLLIKHLQMNFRSTVSVTDFSHEKCRNSTWIRHARRTGLIVFKIAIYKRSCTGLQINYLRRVWGIVRSARSTLISGESPGTDSIIHDRDRSRIIISKYNSENYLCMSTLYIKKKIFFYIIKCTSQKFFPSKCKSFGSLN